MTPTAPLHPDLQPLAGLLGSWEGPGRGSYPTIESFEYVERVSFGHVGKPFLAYSQRTCHPHLGTPMHAESGYLRPARAAGDRDQDAPVRIELMLAHPTGIVEIEEGTLDAGLLSLRTTTLGLSPTAKRVRSLRREFHLGAESLTYDLWMAYADVPETHHLHAELVRSA